MLNAHYFDGRSARLHLARLRIADGLIALEGEVEKTYPVAGTRLAEPFAQAPDVLYFPDGARCEIPGPRQDRLLEALLGHRRSRVVRWQEQVGGALLALALLAALLAWSLIWGLPALGERLADAVPPSVDQAFGERALAGLDRSGILTPSTLDLRQQQALARLLREITPPGMQVRLATRGSAYMGLNAFALPDGTIIVTDLLAWQILGPVTTPNPVQRAALAGMLAHEIAHVKLRHTVRAVASSSLTAALSSALLGDFSGASAMSATLADLNFSREMETEADDFAIRLLQQHGYSTLPFADLLEWLEKASEEASEHDDLQSWFARSGASFFDTHPLTAERTARIRAAAKPR
jgi:Zn-dependent protease with chaperone function